MLLKCVRVRVTMSVFQDVLWRKLLAPCGFSLIQLAGNNEAKEAEEIKRMSVSVPDLAQRTRRSAFIACVCVFFLSVICSVCFYFLTVT